MKSLLLFIALSSSSLFANLPNMQCSPLEKYDLYEWTLEVSGAKGAFFDNDSWAEASYMYDLESMPAQAVFQSNNPKDPFRFTIQMFPMPSGKIKGMLYYNSKEEPMEFDCRLVQEKDFYYL